MKRVVQQIVTDYFVFVYAQDIIMLVIGGHYLWPNLPLDSVFAAPFVLVYFAGLVSIYTTFMLARFSNIYIIFGGNFCISLTYEGSYFFMRRFVLFHTKVHTFSCKSSYFFFISIYNFMLNAWTVYDGMLKWFCRLKYWQKTK